MIRRKNLKAKKVITKKKQSITQEDMVVDYLVRKGTKGSTNFEMMMDLRMCDVRKRISNINADPLSEFKIESVFETGDSGKTYKRYWAVPDYLTLEDFLSESKYSRKPKKKRTGGGNR
jgi:hypothetical protein